MKPGQLRGTLSGACFAAALALLPAAAQEPPAPQESAVAVAVAPLPVFGVSSALSAPDTMVVSWNPATSVGVSAYRVYYGSASATYNGTQASEGGPPSLSR